MKCQEHFEENADARVHTTSTATRSLISDSSLEDFLDVIGLQHSIGQHSDRYANLDQLFVPSSEFPTICQLLDTNNFVLLLGDPQIGKTYTALYLLYQYYQQGYRPFWESVRDLETAYGDAFQRLRRPRFDLDEYVRRRLDGRNAIYIEDPWGKIQFDIPEEFTSSLESLINRVRVSEAKLIITSRSGIFNRLTDLVGKDFAVTLRAELVYGGERHSYGDEERTHLFHNYYHLFHGSDEGCSFSVSVGTQQIRITILGTLLQHYTVRRMIEFTVEYINEICDEPKPPIFVEELYFEVNGTKINSNTRLSNIPNELLNLRSKEAKGASIAEIAKSIHAGSTDIDW